ncbi:hypothetical protein AB0H51_27745, partial [Streptomyces griseoluteus]|uniref:hypothetical protein n=1 Tax=Streptomyces griseoluteus TaxID=29306 RepID=UPI0033CD2003
GGSNVLPDPSFEGAGGAAIAAKQTWLSIDTAFGNGSPSSLKIDATSATAAYRSAELTLLPVTPGDQLYVATDYYPSTTWVGTEINLQVRWEKADGTVLSYGKLSTTTPAKGAWARFSGTVTAPANAVLGRVRVESGNATAGSVWWDNAEVRPVVPGVQIADGAITTPKMVAGSIQGDRIATNSLDADRIVAGSITTSKLNVTTAASLVQKLYDAGADAGRWKVGGTSVSTAAAAANLTSVTVPDSQSGGYVMRAVGGVTSAWRPDILIPYDPNVLYRVSGVVRQTVAGSNTANQRFYMGVQGVAADGVTCVSTTGAAATSNAHYVAAAGVNLTAGAGWTRFVGYLKGYAASGASGTSVASPSPTAPGVLHANARYISPLFFANYSGGTGTAEIDMLTVEVVETGAVQTVNIADGAITTPTMTANTINGDRITGNTLNADKIVGKSITAAQIQGLSITAAELAADSVTATKIKAGEIDATHIKVGAITADRLDANAINGKTITGSTLQTAASGARVVLDTELAAYGSGSQAIVIQPDYTNITQTSPSPRLYFTSDDGTNLAFLQVVGAGDTANFFTYSGAFTDPADSSVYRWRTSLGQDAWITERVAEKWTGRYTSGYPKISLTKAQASIYAPDIYAAGVFHANNIASGRVTITPSAANTPTSTTVTGLGLSGANPRGIATASTTVPGTSVTGVAVTDLSTSSATVWVTRANTISTVVDYLVIAS